MQISKIQIHNYRSILDMTLAGHDYMLLVGANNAGKSTVINALRAFYDDLKWSADDFPKVGALDAETWIEITFSLSDDEWDGLAESYKEGAAERLLTVRRYLKSEGRVKASQSNLYGVVNGVVEDGLFYGARQISLAKVGRILYIPALTTTAEQTKMSGPSPLRNMLNFLLKKIVSKSEAYAKVSAAFEELNAEARGEGAHHQAVNELVVHCAATALANPIKFAKCLETHLGIAADHRQDKKPLEILKAVSSGAVAADKLTGLKTQFKAALAIQ